jgi:hypothetical protein
MTAKRKLRIRVEPSALSDSERIIMCVDTEQGERHMIKTWFITNYKAEGKWDKIVAKYEAEMKNEITEQENRFGREVGWLKSKYIRQERKARKFADK